MLRLALFLLCSLLPLHADPKRPLNVLFCFADDWGRYASAYAAADGKGTIHELIHTPNIDRIAREGALFRHAFVNAPSCTPCRSALLSGRHFFSTGRGAILQGAYWDSTIPSFPLLLRDAGHHIGETFKVWSPGDPTDAPFGTGRYAYEKHGNRFNGFSKNASALVASGTPFPDASRQLLDGIGTNFDEFLAARPANSPWFYWFGPTNVHRSWKQGSGKALWNIDPDRFKGRIPPHLPDVPATREDFSDYFGEIQAFDAAIGVLLNRLESSGQIDNTLVVISGDHGMPGMPRGKCNLYDFGTAVALVARFPGRPGNRIIDDFTSLMDLAPTFLEAAGLPLPSGIHGRSLLPLLDSDKSGLIDPARNHVITGRERHVANARDLALPCPQRALRTADHLYIRNFAPDRWPMGNPKAADASDLPSTEVLSSNTHIAFADMDASPTKAWLILNGRQPEWQKFYDLAFAKRPAEELYDLRKDPAQLANLAADPAHAATRDSLSRQLLDSLRAAGDPRLSGDGLTFERPPFSDLPTPRRPR